MKELINAIDTTIISPEQAAADGFYKWVGAKNDCEFHGEFPGYVCGWCVEVKKPDGELGYMSCTFTNDFEQILLPETAKGELCDRWNDLGISANLRWDCVPTGRIVFRGYHRDIWLEDEGEYGFLDASKEVEEIWKKYVVA